MMRDVLDQLVDAAAITILMFAAFFLLASLGNPRAERGPSDGDGYGWRK